MEDLLPFEKIKRILLVKKDSIISEKYGCNPNERNVEELLNYGVICINKQQGPTSHQISDYVKKMLNVKQCGHGGSLDPNVTGILPVALGNATRIMQTLLKGGKEYIALMHIHQDVSMQKILETSKDFIGMITQMPPIKSAVKRQFRNRQVYYLNILEIENRYVLFKMGCEAGTYIRRVCDSWGKVLGTNANMQELVRTKAGPFTDDESYSLIDLKDAYSLYLEGNEKRLKQIIKPIEYAISHLPKVYVFDSAVNNLCHGSQLYSAGISKLDSGISKDDLVAVMTLKKELISLGYASMTSEEIMKSEKGLAVRSHKVFMKPDFYPRNIL